MKIDWDTYIHTGGSPRWRGIPACRNPESGFPKTPKNTENHKKTRFDDCQRTTISCWTFVKKAKKSFGFFYWEIITTYKSTVTIPINKSDPLAYRTWKLLLEVQNLDTPVMLHTTYLTKCDLFPDNMIIKKTPHKNSRNILLLQVTQQNKKSNRSRIGPLFLQDYS